MERTEAMTAATAPRRELPGSYIDWPAVLGGTVVASAAAAIFTAFGAALGLTTISAEPGEGSFNVWLAVTAVWIVLSLVLSYLAGGYVAGRMRRRLDDAGPDEVAARDAVNGLVVWGLGMLVATWMTAGVVGGAASAVGTAATAAGSAAGGIAQAAGSVVGGAAQGVGQAVAAAVPDNAGEEAFSYINDTLMRPVLSGMRQSDGMTTPGTPAQDDAELARQTGVILGNVLRTGEISDDERAFLTAATAQRTGLSQAEVEARVNQAVEGVQKARAEAERIATETRAEAERLVAEAREQAIKAAETARITTILTAFLLASAALVAAAAAVAGGVRGGRHRDEGRFYGGFSYGS